MIAYRTETAMTGLITGKTVDLPEARQLLQDLFVTEADILPDIASKQLLVRVHPASKPVSNKNLLKLFDQLNDTSILYPGTDIKMVYELHGYSSKNLKTVSL